MISGISNPGSCQIGVVVQHKPALGFSAASSEHLTSRIEKDDKK